MSAVDDPSILIIEDDPAIVNMFELTFALEGFDTESISDGRIALERINGAPPTLVILDVMMPGVDGYTVLQALKSQPGWEDVKVVVCSALKSDEDVWKGWQAGADYYLVKPFDLDHLRDVVGRLIAGSPVT